MKDFTDPRMRALRRELDRRERELRQLITAEQTLIEDDYDAHMADSTADDADRADARARAAVERQMIDRYVREIGSVVAARKRIDLGTFGLCIDCGNDIDYGRLRAMPAALRCARCQERHEWSVRG
jgi:RNA polymerase-binding transcription factor DksA